MKRILTIIVALSAYFVAGAQYVVSDKYDLWFEDTGREVTTRKSISCQEDWQDLWNGCYVRLSGRRVYVYRDGSSILYGEEIHLLYNGYYKVRRSGTWYLADEDGDLVNGIYGKDIAYYPYGYVAVLRSSGYWDIYHSSGRKVETYSYEIPRIYYNGCWGVKQGTYWYACDQDGDKLSGVYGDRIILLDSGRWKCIRGSYVTYIDL